jgi:hypothetical protein
MRGANASKSRHVAAGTIVFKRHVTAFTVAV